ncbi:hypothetical protein [Ensifer sp.]|uniref:hypothetical protein n=1 Tax=Ensifer sp. TaxID=1872086 RepID=UPI000DD6B12D|nr:hypothetical protein [Ensifer sp.]
MNQREEFKEKPLVDPVTGQPTPLPTDPAPVRSGRSSWPLFIILLAGLVLALIAWLPAELNRDSQTATPPAATGQSTTGETATPPAADTTTTAPADTTTAPSGTAPSGGTMTAPETAPQQGTTPPATNGTTQPAPVQ